MMHGRNNGKKNLASAIVKQALEIVHLATNKNPLETVLEAIANAGPREDSTKIGIKIINNKELEELLKNLQLMYHL